MNGTNTASFDFKKAFDQIPDDTLIAVRKFEIVNTLESVMARLGNIGYYTHVRFDALRSSGKFTVIVNGDRLTDTDNPRDELLKFEKSLNG